MTERLRVSRVGGYTLGITNSPGAAGILVASCIDDHGPVFVTDNLNTHTAEWRMLRDGTITVTNHPIRGDGVTPPWVDKVHRVVTS